MENNKVNINLQLGEHRISTAITLEQEKWYRDATVLLNRRFKWYSEALPKAPAELIWVYVALEMGTNLQALQERKSLAPVETVINHLNNVIEQIIN